MILFPVLIVASLVYTTWRLWRILPFSPLWKTVVTGIFLLCFATLFLHYGLGNRMPISLAAATYEIGNSWLIFFLYLLIFFAVLGIGRLVHLVPASFLKDSLAGTGTVLGLIAVLLTYGGFHYRHKYRQEIDIRTEKPLEKPLTLVLASDLHVGYHNRKAELGRWIGLINAEKPDLVLFAGDIIDGAVRPVREWHYEEEFHRLEAPAYASLGNHEYIAGIDDALSFYADAGIRLLRDASVLEEGIRIVGRDDRSNRERLDLSALVPSDSLFTLLLDHQPSRLEEAEACGIDFQFSGHTHHGQIWPGNWVTDLMFEKAYGPYQRGNTRYYVSSGLGIWGGKFRIGTCSEYIVLKIHN